MSFPFPLTHLVLTILLSSSLLLLPRAGANFNLFVDKEEFHRITGGTLSQVFLVQDGVVNDYALRYVMNVPFHVNYLDFRWQATQPKRPVHYELLIEFSDYFALLQPSANVSKVGRLPNRLETLRISLPCSGRLTTEVPVIIRFTFHTRTNNKNNLVNVNLRRNKICLLKEENRPAQSVTESLSEGVDPGESSSPAPPSQSSETRDLSPSSSHSPFLAFLFGAVAVSGSIATVFIVLFLRRRLREKVEEDGGRSPGSLIKFPTSPVRNPFWTEMRGGGPGDTLSRSMMVSKGPGEVSPYACAQILGIKGRDAGYYANVNGGFSASPNPNFARYNEVGIYENFNMRPPSSLGSASVVQIDGFQCGRSLVKGKDVVERFL